MQPPMGFCQSIKSCMCSNYVNIKGRARRSEFWYFFLIITLIFLLIIIQHIFLNPFNKQYSKDNANNFIRDIMLYSGIEIIIVTIFFIPLCTVIMRRLNDIGKSRMLILIILIPLVGLLILLYFMTIDSEPSTNKYGPSPKYEVNNNNQTENFIAQNDPIYPPNPIPNNTYPQDPYANPVQQDPNQNLIYQQPYQNPVP